MKVSYSINKTIKRLSTTFIVLGCMFTSSAYAVIAGESHACKVNSSSGHSGIGGYYFPASRSAATRISNHQHTDVLNLYVQLTAYNEGTPTRVLAVLNKTVTAQPAEQNKIAGVMYTDTQTAPGHGVAWHHVWSPIITRLNGTFISPNLAFGSNGCRNKVIYL